MNIFGKMGWVAAATLGIAIVAALAGVVQAGPLDPDEAPAPSMVTQNELPPAWHQDLSATGGCTSARFECVLGNVAVLDHETGLVWERTPSTAASNWSSAVGLCNNATTGGKRGWHLPSVEELTSLYRTSGLPAGHPFTATSFNLWTSNTDPANAANALVVFNGGGVGTGSKAGNQPHWCVRGGRGHDAY